MNDRLLEAGWFEGRAVNVTEALDQLIEAGFKPLPWFKQVVGEFDGLVVDFSRNGRPDRILLEVSEAVWQCFPETVSSYEDRVGGRLLPIGKTYDEHLLLLVDDRGCWYGAFEFDLWLVGTSAHDAVDRILADSGFEPVPGNVGLTVDDTKH